MIQRVKPLNRKSEDRICTRVPRKPWEVLSIDLMEAYPFGKATIKSIVDTFERELFRYPRALLSDNGLQFLSRAMGDALMRWGMNSDIPPTCQSGRKAKSRVEERASKLTC
ncbi:Integrase catalytic domain-containing protein [Aphis craccivora]|uniref:Integrase catalytic domain-containing protein n=1 Tax=Aphis craccivora TaxID=307492 RepID=A0A6G0Z833_APHCR|nr:Integrase catalytic domain-containing protein [Aphis craccivora]